MGYATVNAGFTFGAVFFLLADRRCVFSGLLDSRLPIKKCDISRDGNNHIVSQNLVTEFLQNGLRLGKQPKVRQLLKVRMPPKMGESVPKNLGLRLGLRVRRKLLPKVT